ncbi:MAG: sulfatase-like hydrolase/transferase, partial [Verrucomicrobiota bacterium]|nr:sulfatase-like hydrolase/transferase [Verrucomicrobiota bacterium]
MTTIRRLLLLGLLPLLPAHSFAQTAAGTSPARPNVVFVLMDDHRWDDLGCTGHPFVKTPHIDRI